MIKRFAFFEGAIKPGCETAFDAYVNEKLVPLWTRFPGALRVEVLREVEAEDGSHRYPMALATTYPDKAAIATALASPVRYESREVISPTTRRREEVFVQCIFLPEKWVG